MIDNDDDDNDDIGDEVDDANVNDDDDKYVDMTWTVLTD